VFIRERERRRERERERIEYCKISKITV